MRHTRYKISTALAVFCVILVSCGNDAPETFDELLADGKRAFVNQNYAEARRILGEAYTIKPSDYEVLYFMGMAYSRDFMLDSAYSYLRRADLLNPGDREVNLELYPLAINLEEWTQAIKSVRTLIATGDPESKYYRDLAELHAMKQQYGNAYRYLRLQLDRKPDDSSIYMELADLAQLHKKPELALAILDTAMERFGSFPQLRRARAGALASNGQFADAERMFRDLISEGYDSEGLRLALASALIPQDSRQKRIEAYNILKATQDSLGTIQPPFDSIMSALEDTLELSGGVPNQ